MSAVRDAAQQALEWIAEKPEKRPCSAGKMVATLIAALAEQQEPFGYVSEHNCEGPYKYQFHLDAATVYRDNCKSVKAVYTEPQPQTEPSTCPDCKKPLHQDAIHTCSPQCT